MPPTREKVSFSSTVRSDMNMLDFIRLLSSGRFSTPWVGLNDVELRISPLDWSIDAFKKDLNTAIEQGVVDKATQLKIQEYLPCMAASIQSGWGYVFIGNVLVTDTTYYINVLLPFDKVLSLKDIGVPTMNIQAVLHATWDGLAHRDTMRSQIMKSVIGAYLHTPEKPGTYSISANVTAEANKLVKHTDPSGFPYVEYIPVQFNFAKTIQIEVIPCVSKELVMTAFKKLPKIFQDLIKEIRVLTRHREGVAGTYGKGVITIYCGARDWELDVVLHEVGHAVLNWLAKHNFDAFRKWIRLHEKTFNLEFAKGGPPTEYGQTDFHEDFAETFMYYYKSEPTKMELKLLGDESIGETRYEFFQKYIDGGDSK